MTVPLSLMTTCRGVTKVKREWDNPENVPPITDVRFIGWDQREPSNTQLWKLRQLLREEGVNAEDLYGDGFSSVDSLSRWGVSWGITYLDAAQEARHIEGTRRYMEQERARVDEERVKYLMGQIIRSPRG